GWRCTPFFAPGKGQHNLCINVQPPDLKDILKEAIRVLHHDCSFKHRYIPVDSQTDCLVRILIKAATKLNRGDYTLRAQMDAILQRTASDLLITRVSLYWTNIKCIASDYVAHGYGLKDSKPEQDVQVASLLTNDRFIFKPREDGINPAKPFHHPVIIQTIQEAFFKRRRSPSIAQRHPTLFTSSIIMGASAGEQELPHAMVAIVAVHASLDEKISNVEFSADTYEDSYNIYMATMEEIWAKNPAAYHRLMSDLYKLAS
ncbi:hypothetical protein EI94DRAFT_1620474, partial [Lactarius quietus]